MTPSPQPPRAPHAPNTRSLDTRDPQTRPGPAETLSAACGDAYLIARRLLGLSSHHDGDRLAEQLKAAAADLERIADTLTYPVSRWPMEEIDG